MKCDGTLTSRKSIVKNCERHRSSNLILKLNHFQRKYKCHNKSIIWKTNKKNEKYKTTTKMNLSKTLSYFDINGSSAKMLSVKVASCLGVTFRSPRPQILLPNMIGEAETTFDSSSRTVNKFSRSIWIGTNVGNDKRLLVVSLPEVGLLIDVRFWLLLFGMLIMITKWFLFWNGSEVSLSLSFLCLSFCLSSFCSFVCSMGVATAANDFVSSALNNKSQ